jgi:hypothetical protein
MKVWRWLLCLVMTGGRHRWVVENEYDEHRTIASWTTCSICGKER